jgi:cell wall-associated NlpC family hydrolase
LDHGVVALSALDVRRRPDHRSELLSQFLLGETVRVLAGGPDEPWWRVRSQFDDYEGWVRRWGIVPAAAARVRRWSRLARARVVALFAEVRTAPGAGGLVAPLFWQSRVIAGRVRAGHRPVELPDGRRGWVVGAALAPEGRVPRLADRLLDLLGIPYLWGGRTPAGLDCSGFVQLLLAEQGMLLPRDAADQHRACRRLAARDVAEPGDLVFFAPRGGRVAHVGLWLGDGAFVHSRGTVRIGSLDPRSPFYENELAAQLRGFGRPVGAPGPRRSRRKP